MPTSVPGFKVGHYTDTEASTGCTVILCPPKTRGSCEVRGSSPGSRELALLGPDKTMQEVHAILLTGGSAFGLAAADGVMKWLEDHGIGYETPWVKVPIVPTAVIFDLNIGEKATRPNAQAGYRACENAMDEQAQEGNVGAGSGATVGKWKGMDHRMKGGFGWATETVGNLVVGAAAVVNSVGDIVDKDGKILAGARSTGGKFFGDEDPHRMFERGKVLERTNTTLVVTAMNADLSKIELHRICQRMHDGMARAIIPAHTSYDGDVTFALSQGNVKADFDLVAEISASLTSDAIRRAVRSAKSVSGAVGLAG
ncbi:MAG: P1 family peptidase [Ignavibacteriales bacterium]|nr:P1 family peptidase [Ignavibacteriales bacterium]